MRIQAQDARIRFPLRVELDNVLLGTAAEAEGIAVERISAGLDFLSIFRGTPFRFRLERKQGFVDLRLSSPSPKAGRGSLAAANVSTADIPGLLPGNGLVLSIERCEVRWSRPGGGNAEGKGRARFSGIRLPIPAPESPVREALIRDADVDFSMGGGGLHVSSLRGRYEGAPIEGNGEIAQADSLARARITFNLRIPNPYEGNVATIFNLVAKNAKNANLRISGPLLSPAGEFLFF